jgi:hypothetical protein
MTNFMRTSSRFVHSPCRLEDCTARSASGLYPCAGLSVNGFLRHAAPPTLASGRRQICATPPSTNSSMPVTKLESLEARKSAAVAISSGRPIVPRGMSDTK